MSRVWNDCVLIFENGKFTPDFNREMLPSWQKYSNVIRGKPKENVWFDLVQKICFGSEQTFYHNPEDFSFFSRRRDFLNNPLWGTRCVDQSYGRFFEQQPHKSDELIYLPNGS